MTKTLKNGYIKIYRSLLDWEWYDDPNTKIMFWHLLLTVSIEDSNWHGIDIKRGSRVSSYSILASECHLTIRQARTAIKHLEMTGEVTRSVYPKFTVFTVNNYDKFQQVTSKTQGKRQGNDKQIANQAPSKRQQYKKIYKKILRNKEKESVSPVGVSDCQIADGSPEHPILVEEYENEL